MSMNGTESKNKKWNSYLIHTIFMEETSKRKLQMSRQTKLRKQIRIYFFVHRIFYLYNIKAFFLKNIISSPLILSYPTFRTESAKSI